MDTDQFRLAYGQHTLDDIDARGHNFLFTLLNITSWTNLLWAGIGLLGQVAFFGRMFIQWVASERRKESVVPEAFWWLSLAGGVLLLTYFVWRQDPVGILGQASGIVIYARNIRLIHKKRRRAVRDEERRLAAEASLSAAAVAESTRDLAAMSRPASAGAAESREVHTAGAGRG